MKQQKIADQLPRKLLDVISRFNASDKKIRKFGTDTALHLSEIHLIEFIGDHENLYVSEIAREREVTKGAISQTLLRLEKKDFVIKNQDPENRSHVIVSLTGKGWTAYQEHQKYHEHIAALVSSCVKGKSEREIDAVYSFLTKLERLL